MKQNTQEHFNGLGLILGPKCRLTKLLFYLRIWAKIKLFNF